LRSDCPASFGTYYRIGKPGSPDFSCGMTLIRCAAKSQPSQQHRLQPPCRRPPAKLSSAQANCAATAQDIERGKILMMVDVPFNRSQEIVDPVRRRHPEAVSGGTEPTIPAFP
jgi:hypothetical protein